MAHFSPTVVDRLSCRRGLPGLRCAVTSPRSVWRLPLAWRSMSPTTCSPCGFKCPSPDALCVLRRLWEGPEEATPSLRRRAWQARQLLGSPPPAPRPWCDAASVKRLYLFAHRSRGYHPGLQETPQRHESLTGGSSPSLRPASE